jgi:spore coat protein U-like protein
VSRGSALTVLAALTALLCARDAAAQLAPSCTISVTSVAFGSYDVFNVSATDSTGTISYRCNSKATNISITLSRGSSSTFAPRTLTRGSETLTYNLFTNAARTTIWGDGTGGTSVYTNTNPPNNRAVNLTIYGRIPASQDVSSGNYTDTVAVTINF